jgi:hypothetical protein
MILKYYNKGVSGMHPEKGVSGMQPDNFEEDAVHTGPPERLSWERPALRKLLANDAEAEQARPGSDSPNNRMS